MLKYRLMPTAAYCATVAASGSAWGDSGLNCVKSTTTVANDTVTGTAGSFCSVRGTQAYSTGKRYFEIKILTAPVSPLFIPGYMDDTTATGASMDGNQLVNSAGWSMFNGNNFSNGWQAVNLGSAFSLADNDRLGFSIDLTNEFYYMHLNNTYFLSGDPTSGPLGTGAVGNGAQPGTRPMVSVWGAGNGVYQLITSAADLLYLPSGYTAWG